MNTARAARSATHTVLPIDGDASRFRSSRADEKTFVFGFSEFVTICHTQTRPDADNAVWLAATEEL